MRTESLQIRNSINREFIESASSLVISSEVEEPLDVLSAARYDPNAGTH